MIVISWMTTHCICKFQDSVDRIGIILRTVHAKSPCFWTTYPLTYLCRFRPQNPGIPIPSNGVVLVLLFSFLEHRHNLIEYGVIKFFPVEVFEVGDVR